MSSITNSRMLKFKNIFKFKKNPIQTEEILSDNVGVVNQNTQIQKRDQWRTRFDFIIACMGFSIGLGNVWRFPYLCYKNGGGAFLIPYFISVFLAGIPLFLLEVTVGQLMCRGAIAAWNICPLFQGIGFGCTVINFFLNCYYTVILSWALHFLFSSFTSELPWVKCNQTWNTNACHVYKSSSESNDTINFINNKILAIDPTTEYWENRVLRISNGIENIGNVQWDLALCLLAAWIIIFLCICKGVKTSGKIMYFTALAPYVFMIILLIRTALLEGSYVGIAYYLKPDWNKLTDMTVWSDAGTQIYFSYSVGLGVLTAFGSYNKYNHNAFRDCLLFAVANTFTSLLAGFVIFATLGYMSVTSNIPINLVAESGPGLAFVIYPKAIGTMPGSPFWSICFFSMIILLGIDSMFGGVEGLVACFTDYFPSAITKPILRISIVGILCIIPYFIGLTMVTNGGMYIFQLFDYYSGSRIILVIGILETTVIGYIYGVRRITNDMKSMYNISIYWYNLIFWCILTPIFSVILLVFSIIVYKELTYSRAVLPEPYKFPAWSVSFGWIMASSSVFCIPTVMIIRIIRAKGSFIERIKFLCKPHFYARPEEVKISNVIDILDMTENNLIKRGTDLSLVTESD